MNNKLPYRACTKCGKMGHWYAHCPGCQRKINVDYERIRREQASKKPG